MPDRFSRHYADTVALAQHPDGQRAITLDDVRAKVVDWKSRFFGSSSEQQRSMKHSHWSEAARAATEGIPF
jgi:hypothetical protein